MTPPKKRSLKSLSEPSAGAPDVRDFVQGGRTTQREQPRAARAPTPERGKKKPVSITLPEDDLAALLVLTSKWYAGYQGEQDKSPLSTTAFVRALVGAALPLLDALPAQAHEQMLYETLTQCLALAPEGE